MNLLLSACWMQPLLFVSLFLDLLSPYIEILFVRQSLNGKFMRTGSAMNGGAKVGQSNPAYVGQRNFHGRTRRQRSELLNNSENEIVMLPASGFVESINLDLAIFQLPRLVAGFGIFSHG